MTDTAQQAYYSITAYINLCGGIPSNWYCGITNDNAARLFTQHKVSEESGSYIGRVCESADAARAVENALLKLGCDGGSGGGDNSSICVYAYLKTSITNP